MNVVNVAPGGGHQGLGLGGAEGPVAARVAEGGPDKVAQPLLQPLDVVLQRVDRFHLHLAGNLNERVGVAPLDFELGVQGVAKLFRFLHLKQTGLVDRKTFISNPAPGRRKIKCY